MAGKKTKHTALPSHTIIEVVAMKGNIIVKKQMEYYEALNMKKSPGWNYINYQLGFCSIKATQ